MAGETEPKKGKAGSLRPFLVLRNNNNPVSVCSDAEKSFAISSDPATGWAGHTVFFSLARSRSHERKSAGSEFVTPLTWRKLPEGVGEGLGIFCDGLAEKERAGDRSPRLWFYNNKQQVQFDRTRKNFLGEFNGAECGLRALGMSDQTTKSLDC